MKLKIILISLVLAGLCSASAWAQQAEKVDTLRASKVTADRKERDDASTQTGLQRIDAGRIHRGFALFNTPDVIKTLQTLPGVAAGTELMSGIYVHGGDGTDNLFMLDGVPIYQVSHLVGLFSSFNSDVVESLDFYKSGFPARYGGRASSVVDVRTKDGDFEEYHGLFAIGIVDGRIQAEGPIVKGKTSFNVALRRTWLDVVTTPIIMYANHRMIKENGKEEASRVSGGYNFSDFNARITHKFAEDNMLTLNVYGGEDLAKMSVDEPTVSDAGGVKHMGYSTVGGDLKWGNFLTSLGWQYDITPDLYLNSTAYHSRNYSNIGIGLKEWVWVGKDAYDSISEDVRSHVNVTGVKSNLGWYATPKQHVRAGVMVQHNDYRPGRDYVIDFQSAQIPRVKDVNELHYQAVESALYAEDELSVTPWLKVDAGLRGVLFAVNGRNWMKLEPRLSMKVQCAPNTSVRMSYTEMNQFDHSIATSYLDLPTNTWMPSTATIKPMFSRQFAGGVYSTLPHNIKLTVEGWYKTMSHLYEYGGLTTLYPPIDSWEVDFTEGKGKSYGMEFGLEYEGEKLSAQAYYTLSWSLRKFDNFYFDWYPDRNDNRHKIDLMANYNFTPRFELYAGWHYHTGNNMTAATYNLKLDTDRYLDVGVYERPNNLKLPDYHRLDLGLNWHRTTRRGRETTLNLSIYNAYCRMNALFGYIENEYEEGYDDEGFYYSRPTGRKLGTAVGVIPIIPTLGYTIKF